MSCPSFMRVKIPKNLQMFVVFSAEMLVTVFVTSQISCCVEKMNLPAAADAASPCFSAATVRTSAVTAAMRCPATTARLSPAGRQTSVCPETNCVTDEWTAGTAGTSLGSCVVCLG